ncbi:MAG: hypothetical protein J6X70_08625 [Muribaculaceae bacterium]|nr:hypothetical protein [Muribaculaceae bacterium]
MKKITLLLMGLVAMTGMVSCDDKDPDQTAQFQQEYYIRSVNIDDQSVQFSKSVSVINVNYTKDIMDITVTVKLNASSSTTIQLKELALAYDAYTGMFSIKKGATTTVSDGATVDNFDGTFDYNTGVMYLNFFVDGKYHVVCTTRLLYPYGNSTSTYEKEGQTKTCTVDDFCLALELNDEGTKANLTLYNVQLETEKDKVIYIEYASLPVTVNVVGYNLEAASLEAKIDNLVKPDYNITDFKATITDNGRRINGSFIINGHTMVFNAKMLNEKE